MDPISTVAAGGMRARLESLEMLANNIANGSTAGYKVDREFYSLYRDIEADGGLETPLVEKPWTDYSQGTLQVTGNALDLALDGKGFFAVNGPSGPLYTRNGAFHVSSAGEVVNAEGYPLRLAGGGTLRSQSNDRIDIGVDGTVRQGGLTIGRLDLADFPPSALTKQGSSMFRVIDDSQKPSSASAQVHQGKLEGSNVASAESAVRLVGIMRQFEMLQKTIAIGGDMNRRALEEVARVGQ